MIFHANCHCFSQPRSSQSLSYLITVRPHTASLSLARRFPSAHLFLEARNPIAHRHLDNRNPIVSRHPAIPCTSIFFFQPVVYSPLGFPSARLSFAQVLPFVPHILALLKLTRLWYCSLNFFPIFEFFQFRKLLLYLQVLSYIFPNHLCRVFRCIYWLSFLFLSTFSVFINKLSTTASLGCPKCTPFHKFLPSWLSRAHVVNRSSDFYLILWTFS